MTLPRGFKTDAEKRAVHWRRELGAAPGDNLNLTGLAALLDVSLVDADTLVDSSRLEELDRLQAFAFSAATFEVAGRTFIVTNPLRSPGRRTSDIAHELAHLLLHHVLTEIQNIDGVPFRTCSPDQEEQATALGGTLLLPRPLLLASARRGRNADDIAVAHGVTPEMARYRYNSTGVAKQLERRGA